MIRTEEDGDRLQKGWTAAMDERRTKGIWLPVAVLCFYLAAMVWGLAAYPDGWILLGLAAGGCLTAACRRISGKIRTDAAAMILLGSLGLVLLETWNAFLKPYPMSDYEVLWNGAGQILNGTFAARAADPADYFNFYRFQIPFTAYLASLAGIFGSLQGVIAFRAVVPVMTSIVMYRTLRLGCSVREAFFPALVFTVFPFVFFGSGVLNNQIECMLFESLAIYAFARCRDNRKKAAAMCGLSGALLSVGNLFRPTASVIFIAFVIVLALRFLRGRNKGELVCLGALAAGYLAVRFSSDGIFRASGIAPEGITIGNLWFKLSLGLTGNGITGIPTVDAEHTNLYFDLQQYGFDTGAYQAAASSYVAGLIRTPGKTLAYVLWKILFFAGTVDAQYSFTNTAFLESHGALTGILNGAGIMIYALSVIGTLYRIWKRRAGEQEDLYLTGILIFLGYFAAYILLEAQTRYRYEQYYVLFLLGMPMIREILERKAQRLKQGHR